MNARASLYITNWSLNEPLCQSQSVAYLEALAADGYPSCLITFERDPYVMRGGDLVAAKNRLAASGICWHPVTYHRRTNLVVAGLDGLRGISTAISALVRHRARIVHTRSSIPAAIGLLAARMLGRRFLYDADSELSEEYAGCGHWSRGGVRYRAMSAIEERCRRRADAIVVLTDRLRAEWIRRGVDAPITVIPCCVDTQRFQFDAEMRKRRRRDLGLPGEETLLVYVGKIGVRYLVDESLEFLKAFRQLRPNARLLVLTHDDQARFESMAARHGVEDAVFIRRAEPHEIASWLSAADAGLSLVMTTPSALGTSPIKTSEYLAAGLPVVTTSGIGDLSDAVESTAIGVVLPACDAGSIATAAERLSRLLAASSGLRQRCMEWARSSLDLRRTAVPRYREVYEAMLKPRRKMSPAEDEIRGKPSDA